MTQNDEQLYQTGSVPLVLLTTDEITSLDNILMSYQAYLLRLSGKTERQHRHFSHTLNLRRRFGQLIRAGIVTEERIDLTEGELDTIVAALHMFIELVSRLFPNTKDREMALEVAQHFRQQITSIIQTEQRK